MNGIEEEEFEKKEPKVFRQIKTVLMIIFGIIVAVALVVGFWRTIL